jgi:hypothetical protein
VTTDQAVWTSISATLDGSCDSGEVWAVGPSAGAVTAALRASGFGVRRKYVVRQQSLPPSLLDPAVAAGTAAAYRSNDDEPWRVVPLSRAVE